MRSTGQRGGRSPGRFGRTLAAGATVLLFAAIVSQSPTATAQQEPAHECTAYDAIANTIVNSCTEQVSYEGVGFFARNCRTVKGTINPGETAEGFSRGGVCVQYSDATAQRNSGYDTCSNSGYVPSRFCRTSIQILPANKLPGLDVSAASLVVNEGSSRTFAVALTTQPTGQVTVTLSQPANTAVTVDVDLNAAGDQTELIFTTSNWNTAQVVTVSAAQDDDAADGAATINLTAADGGYDSITAGVSVRVTDDDPAELILTPNTLAVDEGGRSSFTVRLATQPSEDVTVTLTQPSNTDVTVDTDSSTAGSQTELTFTDSNWDAPQTVAVNAGEDVDSEDESAIVNLNAAGSDYDNVAGRVTVNVTDVDIGLSISAESLSVDENGSGSFTVALRTQPSAAVTVALSQGGVANGDVTFSPASLNFTASDWSTAQIVTVSAADDSDRDDDSALINLAASGGDYAGVTGSVTVSIPDDDIGLSLSATSLSVDEGGSVDVMIMLIGEPSATVSVTLIQPSNGDVTVDSDSSRGGNQTRMLFTTSNWDQVQTFSVSAAEDEDSADEVATISLSASGGGYNSITASLSVTVNDNDRPALNLTPAALTLDEGEYGTFSVVLAAPPSEAVPVALSQSGTANPDITFSPSSLTFTADNWDTVRTVTVSAAEDADSSADRATISLSASGGDYAGITASLAVTVSDDESVGLTLSATELVIEEGGSGTFTVRLAVGPGGARTVLLRSDNSDVTLSPTSLTFAADGGSAAQTVTVSAKQDDDKEGETATITFTGTGITAGAELAVTVADDEAQARPEEEREGAVLQLALIASNIASATSDIIAQRFDAPHGERSATVDGQQIALERSLARDLAAGFAARAGARGAPQSRFAEDRFGAERPSGDWLGGIPLEDGRPLRSGDAAAASDRGAALLEGFSYALSPEEAGGDGDGYGDGWSIWGRAGTRGFSRTSEADEILDAGDDIPFAGLQNSVWLGFDRRTDGGMLSGVAYSSSSSDSDYRLREFDASMEADLSIVLPYMEIRTEGGPSAHLMIGLIEGDATLNQTSGLEGTAALSMYLVVAGGSRPAAQLENSTLSWSADLNFSTLSTSAADTPALQDISVSNMQFRGGVKLVHNGLGESLMARPHLAVLLRHDSGDGITGTGIELNAGLQMVAASERFSVGFNVRTLTMHSADDFNDWGVGLQLRLNPRSSGEGLEFALGPTWGAPDDELLDREDAFGLGDAERRHRQVRQRSRGLAGNIGYGLRALGGLLTPYSEYRLTSGAGGSTRQAAGVRFSGGDTLELRLFSERRILGRDDARSRLAVELQRRF